jgi:diacylglycerol kinase (ATP)
MCNYFSIGVESRVGLGFEKKRTGNAHCNKACYGWEGLKKLFCCCGPKTYRVKEVIESMSVFDPIAETETLVFATEKGKTESAHLLMGDPVSILCTNINQMMGG